MREIEKGARTARTILTVALMVALSAAAFGAGGKGKDKDDDEPLPTVAEKTAEMEKRAGLLDVWFDARRGKVWLELPPPAGERQVVAELIYVHGLAQGLGSNPVGLDRGQTSSGQLIEIRRIGPRVLFEEVNLGYRALSDDPDERRATRDSFATSVIWGEKVGALDDDGRSLLDLTSFLVRDAHNVAVTLKQTDQGKFELDPDRSAVDLANCLVFPDNLEFEAVLTYAGDEPGSDVRSTAPVGRSVTLVGHHSLIRLPDDGYRPRPGDWRIGVNSISFYDYAVPLGSSMLRQWAIRHRLEKVDPEAPRSRVEEPIVYYVDRGAPEPVRSALLEGASWWAEAFEAAGFVDAYRVELLPEDAHPLDVRYNVIQWVHRSTRGWSYGGGIVDPRTGEMLKGHVTLGSLRIRQDRLIFEGLAGTAKTGSGDPDDPIEIALARIRQLAAHEVGHTLGMAHNFAASTYDGRASVMDYPAPLVGVTGDGELDFSRAYDTGIGSWDVQCIRYAYAQFPPDADEAAELDKIVREALEDHLFVADQDARPSQSSDPRGNLWDNGDDAVMAFETALEVRWIALGRFGEENVLPGRPLAELEEVLAPLYFHHRYQLDAAAKVVGGMEYSYAVRGDGQWATRIVDGERQRRALRSVLGVLEPEVLDLPEDVLAVLPPRAFDLPGNRELFASSTWPAFDAVGAAATAAGQVVTLLLEPERLGRLYDFHRRDSALPAVGEVLDALVDKSLETTDGESPRHTVLRQTARRVVFDGLIATAQRGDLKPHLRAEVEAVLQTSLRKLESLGRGPQEAALGADVRRFLGRTVNAPASVVVPPADLPPGSPIGTSVLGCSADP